MSKQKQKVNKGTLRRVLELIRPYAGLVVLTLVLLGTSFFALTYSYIMNAIWGPYMDNNNQILRVNMANIRRKLEQNPAQPQYVFTEIGVGYRMRENENGGTV